MTQDKTPPSGISDQVSHAFPSFTKDGTDTHLEGTSHQFKPMFKGDAARGQLARATPQRSQQSGQDDPLETANRRGFEMGYAAGREDACELVQNDLAPIVDDLQNTLSRFNNTGEEIAGIYSANSLKLALAIVEKITGEAPLYSQTDLSAAQSAINEAMMDSFALNLQFNPQDYQLVEKLAACKNHLDWKRYLQMDISRNEQIATGAVQAGTTPMDHDAIQEQIANALDTVLGEPLHKQQE